MPLEEQVNTSIVLQLELLNTDPAVSDSQLTIKVSSDLVYENAQNLVEAVRSSLVRHPKEVVLEMGEVEMMDSSGIRALLQTRKLCEDAGIGFHLISVSDSVARIISMSGLAPVFGLPTIGVDIKPARRHSQKSVHSLEWKTYEFTVASDPSMISVLRSKVAEAAEMAGASGDMLCDIQIAAGEALTNAYRHGSPNKGENKITLRYAVSPKGLIIEIEDEGEPFDPSATTEPDPKEMRDHGMGLFLMRQAMDSVEFCCNCPGNKVKMVKWLSGDRKKNNSKAEGESTLIQPLS